MLKAKLWGTTRTEVANPFCEVHSILVKSGGFCSWHYHAAKWNAFSVVSGSLRIETRAGEGDPSIALDLDAGDFTTIAPGVEHRFFNITAGDCRGLEIYYPDGLGQEDIIRLSEGGRR